MYSYAALGLDVFCPRSVPRSVVRHGRAAESERRREERRSCALRSLRGAYAVFCVGACSATVADAMCGACATVADAMCGAAAASAVASAVALAVKRGSEGD